MTTPQKPQPTSSRTARISAALAVIVIAVVTFIYMGQRPDGDTGKSADSSTPLASAAKLIDRAAAYASEQSPAVTAELRADRSPAYKPADTRTYVATPAAPTVTLSLPEDNDQAGTPLMDKLATWLTDTHGLKVTRPATETRQSIELQSDGTICSLDVSFPSVRLSCEDKSAYDAPAAALAPFAQAMITASKADEKTVLSDLVIKPSQTDGYQTATLNHASYRGVGGAAGVFYKDGDDDWLFFTSTHAAINCNLYDTVELKKAFAGKPCYDADAKAESTITPPRTHS